MIKPIEKQDELFTPDLDLETNEEFVVSSQNGKASKVERKADMRHMLGFLNQSEWIASLNIGNIMQITQVQLEDLVALRRNEQELDRSAFLETISFLIVGYFCMSTEIRFVIQLKDEIKSFPSFDISKKTAESEYWHAKSLEVAVSFLPSDCPLLNHILLSYQKHHAPSQNIIPEEKGILETLRVLKPLRGIEIQKFNPIIRNVPGVALEMAPYGVKPASKMVVSMLKSKEPSEPQSFNIHQGQAIPVMDTSQSSMQQSTQVKKPAHSKTITVNKTKVNKIKKFGKVIKSFCKDLGVDRKTFFKALGLEVVPQGKQVMAQIEDQSAATEKGPRALSNQITPSNYVLDTGHAALLAYTNLD